MSKMRYFIDMVTENTPMPQPVGFAKKQPKTSPRQKKPEEILNYNPDVAVEIEKIFATGNKVIVTGMSDEELTARYLHKKK